MNYDCKKNASTTLLLTVIGLYFFIYVGSMFSAPSIATCLSGYTNLKSNLLHLVDWVWIALIGRIIGAYILCKLALKLGFFHLMRVIVVLYIILALSVSSLNFTDVLLYKDVQFLFVFRFINALLIPAPSMLPSLFLLNQNPKKPIMLSAYVCLAIGIGTILIFKILTIVEFCNGWQNIMLCASVIGGICYLFFEKHIPDDTPRTPPTTSNTSKLDFGKILLVAAFGGTCGITFGYHFAFIDKYVNAIILSGECKNISFSYYYYVLLISIIPVAKFIYRKNIFSPLKISVACINLIAIIIAITPEITLDSYIIEQVLFGILTAVLLVPCHALVYEIFKDTPNYFDGMFWFVTFFSLFAITPHFFLKLLGISSLPWLSLLYMAPISSVFIFALSRYEQKTTQANFNLETN